MSKKIFTLLDTTETFDYEAYVEFCEVNEITPDPENSDGYWNWVSNEKQRMVDDLLLNLQDAKINDEPVMITGSLELWNGRKEIYPMLVEGSDYEKRNNGEWKYKNPAIKKAVEKCMNGMDDVKVEYANGEIVVHGYHHDGTNIFTINKLSKKGIKTIINAEKNGKTIDPKPYMFGKFTEEDLWYV